MLMALAMILFNGTFLEESGPKVIRSSSLGPIYITSHGKRGFAGVFRDFENGEIIRDRVVGSKRSHKCACKRRPRARPYRRGRLCDAGSEMLALTIEARVTSQERQAMQLWKLERQGNRFFSRVPRHDPSGTVHRK